MGRKLKRVCENGHSFFKTSDCPTCPTCEKLKTPATGFLANLSNPARNALLFHGIDTVEKLSQFTEKEILKIHGIGKASLPAFKLALHQEGLSFKDQSKKNKK